jgi:hypothetical protein
MKFTLAAAALLAVLCQTPQALAQYSTVKYDAFVDTSQPDDDLANLFGGGDLAGDLATATFVYDAKLGVVLASATPGGAYDERDGGIGYGGAPSPLISATLSITAGSTTYSYTFTPDYYADVFTSGDDDYIDDIGNSTAGDATYAYIEPYDYAPNGLNQSFSSFGSGYGSYFDPAGSNTDSLDTIVLDIYAVTIDAVPEPQAWSLMIAGLGLTGATARLGRRRAASASESLARRRR